MADKRFVFSISLEGSIEAKDEDGAKMWLKRAEEDACGGILDQTGDDIELSEIYISESSIEEDTEASDDDDE
jgi:hypothetical protein